MPRHRHWLVLIAAQIVVAILLFEEFFRGTKAFAFTDIGSDTYFQFVPHAIHLAAAIHEQRALGWSFAAGLGAPFPMPWDPFSWLAIAGGADAVLGLRIWIFVGKLLLAGWAMHAFLRRLPVGADAALVGALAYTFCGYALVNGQWDAHATELLVYPLLLWAIAHRLQGGPIWVLAAAVAFAIASGAFAVSLCVFIFLTGILSVLVAERCLEHARTWLTRIAPACVLGLLLAAPLLFPQALQVLDSPRVSGAQALFSDRLARIFSIHDANLILAQLAGFFHKNLLGIGDQHAGWMNYLESPGFFVGTLALLLIPQLARGEAGLRRGLWVGTGFIVLYVLFPALRDLAFGFALPYFRVSTLWISLIVLLLFVLALDLVLRQGAHRGLLAGTALLVVAAPLGFLAAFREVVNGHHVALLVLFSAAGTLLLAKARSGEAARPWLPWALLLLVGGEATLIGYPSFHQGRQVVTAATHPYADLSQQAIRAVQKQDAGFYRIEKTFDSVSWSEAMAQDYFGVKSYGFHGSSVVRFYTGLGLIPERGGGVNYTNWLPNFRQRYPLYSLVGVKYMISPSPLGWPGFSLAGTIGDLRVERNELALPLGVVHYQQISEDEFRRAPRATRDLLMFNAVVTTLTLPGLPIHTLESLLAATGSTLDELYLAPVARLQEEGLVLLSFGQTRFAGQVSARARGVLVLSFPFYRGWSATVDSKATPTLRANLGMTAIELGPGLHRVEFSYRAPGLTAGYFLFAAALIVLLLAGPLAARLRRGRNQAARTPSSPSSPLPPT